MSERPPIPQDQHEREPLGKENVFNMPRLVDQERGVLTAIADRLGKRGKALAAGLMLLSAAAGDLAFNTQRAEAHHVEPEKQKTATGAIWFQFLKELKDPSISHEERRNRFLQASSVETWHSLLRVRDNPEFSEAQNRSLTPQTARLIINTLAMRLQNLNRGELPQFIIISETEVMVKDSGHLRPTGESLIPALELLNGSLRDACSDHFGTKCTMDQVNTFNQYLITTPGGQTLMNMLAESKK